METSHLMGAQGGSSMCVLAQQNPEYQNTAAASWMNSGLWSGVQRDHYNVIIKWINAQNFLSIHTCLGCGRKLKHVEITNASRGDMQTPSWSAGSDLLVSPTISPLPNFKSTWMKCKPFQNNVNVSLIIACMHCFLSSLNLHFTVNKCVNIC